VRQWADGVGGFNLRLAKEPSTAEIIAAIKAQPAYPEVVFCGYGEPLTRIETVIAVARFLKENDRIVRVNTNGQANLIHGCSIPPRLKGLVDRISISLNAENAVKYRTVCQPVFGLDAFAGILEFISECITNIPYVRLTAVDIPEVDLQACQAIAAAFGVDFVIR